MNPLFAGRLPGRIDSLTIRVVPDEDEDAIAAGFPAEIVEALGHGEIDKSMAVVDGDSIYIREKIWPALKETLEQLPARN